MAASKKYDDDRLFRFIWRIKNPDGTPQTSEGYGRDAADAFTRLGFGAGAVRALDYHREGTAA